MSTCAKSSLIGLHGHDDHLQYLCITKNFEGAEEDGDSVAETNLPGILTCNGLIFVGKEHATKSTKIYTPRKFLRAQ